MASVIQLMGFNAQGSSDLFFRVGSAGDTQLVVIPRYATMEEIGQIFYDRGRRDQAALALDAEINNVI